MESDGFQRAGGGGANGGNAARGWGEVDSEVLGALLKRVDGVGTGKCDEVECAVLGERGVEGGVRGGRGDLNCGDEDGDGAKFAQAVGQLGGLVGCARDKDATAGEGEH